jgi:hypothetical protein
METRDEKRLRCWESVIPKGKIEALCPVCHCSTIRYNNTSGTTFQQMHIVAARHGGPHESWNLMPGCGCNQNMKHDNLLDWMGTRGNKRSLLRSLFLRKYKSLVAPCYRSVSNCEQVAEWVARTYHPPLLSEYRDWLLLLESDLATILYDDIVEAGAIVKAEPPQPSHSASASEADIKNEAPLVRSPYFVTNKSARDKKGWIALRRMKPQYPHNYYKTSPLKKSHLNMTR